ncbi:G-type lectin S-receptor-like serine/threonine-protein kinase At4g27290 [Rutidosis leptorrhynchoides]|uniref:G-type lectin S-receptor-like serine/threonine-protein kinase At4g27290 n=1 Tax=Rutidosis leptorrhynchoides TaxID=125765 RepID=UPI003A991310
MASPNATTKLHDTGNLVLMDHQGKMMWQSFDYPTDTLLYHMKLEKDYVKGIEWRLSSWKTNQDPAPGEFMLGTDLDGYPENKLKQGAVVTFRGEPWRNLRVTGESLFDKNLILIYNVVITEQEASYKFYIENTSLISRLTLNSFGELQNWVWTEDSKNWKFTLKFPIDMCDTYNVCSAYGICHVDATQQACACLDEKRFVPRNQKTWDKADWSGGCVKRTPLDCKNGSEDFIKYSDLKLPDTEGTWFNMSMTLEECKAKCLQNCTCMAYAIPDVSLGGKGCVLWFNDLFDMHEHPTDGRDIFVRMASSEIDTVALSTSKKKDGAPIKLILSVVVPGVLLIGFISIWFCFSTENILGEGGFGAVYKQKPKGVLEDGLEIAVKRLYSTSNQGVEEFKNEVICISRLQHRNLVKLLGCCIKGDEKLLIYEYMPNKSLDSFIFDSEKKNSLQAQLVKESGESARDTFGGGRVPEVSYELRFLIGVSLLIFGVVTVFRKMRGSTIERCMLTNCLLLCLLYKVARFATLRVLGRKIIGSAWQFKKYSEVNQVCFRPILTNYERVSKQSRVLTDFPNFGRVLTNFSSNH